MTHGRYSPAFLITSIIMVIGFLALISKSNPIYGALFFVPFALGPLILTLIFAVKSPSLSSQILLIISSVLYGIWFSYVFLSAFYWHIDPQSAIALLFIGIYSLPVMIPLWLITHIINTRTKIKTANKIE
jgi:amino acid permease